MFIAAGFLAIVLATWGCKSSTKGGGEGGTGGGTGGSGGWVPPEGCADPNAPDPPAKSCDPTKDIATQCPLPATISQDDGTDTTVYYYSDPVCFEGKCHYCVTSTTSEDPNATGAP